MVSLGQAILLYVQTSGGWVSSENDGLSCLEYFDVRVFTAYNQC